MSYRVTITENGIDSEVFITDSRESAMAVAMSLTKIPGMYSSVWSDNKFLASFNSPSQPQEVLQ